MTCVEKLKELHPEWDEEIIESIVIADCPSDHMRIDLPDVDCEVGACRACWNQVFPDSEYVGIPHEFEYVMRNPPPMGGELRRFVKILEKIEHPYTKQTLYRIRIFGTEGYFDDKWYSEKSILAMFKMRVGG